MSLPPCSETPQVRVVLGVRWQIALGENVGHALGHRRLLLVPLPQRPLDRRRRARLDEVHSIRLDGLGGILGLVVDDAHNLLHLVDQSAGLPLASLQDILSLVLGLDSLAVRESLELGSPPLGSDAGLLSSDPGLLGPRLTGSGRLLARTLPGALGLARNLLALSRELAATGSSPTLGLINLGLRVAKGRAPGAPGGVLEARADVVPVGALQVVDGALDLCVPAVLGRVDEVGTLGGLDLVAGRRRRGDDGLEERVEDAGLGT